MRLASIALMAAITAFSGSPATADEKPVRLKEAPGLDKVEAHYSACHSLDYVQMNSPFLNAGLAGHSKWRWRAAESGMLSKYIHQLIGGRHRTIECRTVMAARISQAARRTPAYALDGDQPTRWSRLLSLIHAPPTGLA